MTPTGQLSQVGRQFYNTDIEVEILSKEETEKMTYVVRTLAEVKYGSGSQVSDCASLINMEMIPSPSMRHQAGFLFTLRRQVFIGWR